MCITPVDGTSRRKRDQSMNKNYKSVQMQETQYNFSESSLKVARKQNLAWAVYATPVLNILGESGG